MKMSPAKIPENLSNIIEILSLRADPDPPPSPTPLPPDEIYYKIEQLQASQNI